MPTPNMEELQSGYWVNTLNTLAECLQELGMDPYRLARALTVAQSEFLALAILAQKGGEDQETCDECARRSVETGEYAAIFDVIACM